MLQTLRKIKNGESSGFTLIELIVTIGIMMLMLSLTLLTYSAATRGAGAKNAAQSIRAAISGAQIQAVQRRSFVRFEARRVEPAEIEQWEVSPNAAAQGGQWSHLPEFVRVETNLLTTGRGDDGRGGDYESADDYKKIAITFGPEGSVLRYAVGEEPDEPCPKAKTKYTAQGQNDQPFALRLASTRGASKETAGTQRQRAWVVVIPLTGGLKFYDQED